MVGIEIRCINREAGTVVRNERRKGQRPDEIIDAAFEEFAAKGYAEARLDDVASRAGISKGLVYVYFKTKEELFKAVVRTFLIPRFAALAGRIEASEDTTEAIIRGPVLATMKEVAASRLVIILRLLIAEGPKHPDLTEFYHREVITRGIAVIRQLIDRGVARGEFRPTPLTRFPQLVVAPMLVALIWRSLFDSIDKLDTAAMLETHIDLLLHAIKTPPEANVP
jgi:AcrR family transcriptional regulator